MRGHTACGVFLLANPLFRVRMASESDSDAEDGPPSPVSATRESIQPLPQHQCEVQLNHLTFSSRICSGNMAKAEIDEDEEGEYNVWTTPDCAGSPHATTCRSWFWPVEHREASPRGRHGGWQPSCWWKGSCLSGPSWRNGR